MSERALAAVPLVLVLLWLAWLLRDELKTGTMGGKGVQVSRAERPVAFGINAIFQGVLLLLLLALLGLLLLR